ncbi:MAG: SpoIID/LytB domain-containing protein [Pseudanabaenaceae cyanobacterium bins.68]|nr:SpoIID/LytB domain-containing protein [Pseudanabaenaceae cyanobacterium bins.68]
MINGVRKIVSKSPVSTNNPPTLKLLPQWLLLSTLCFFGLNQTDSCYAAILRVLVQELKQTQVPVAVTQPARLTIEGQQPTTLEPGRWYNLPAHIVTKIEPSNNGLVRLGNVLYPGELEIRPFKSKVIAINVLPVEEYLRSVVPSEMPASWHLDALKAQAVAARSYAINTMRQRKWGNAPYDLVSDTRDQVYKGFFSLDPTTAAVKPLIHPRTDEAVATTQGYMLKQGFKGYYRARLQRNWVSWAGGYMPVSDGQHLDQEMSQQMAKMGWNWLQILSWWYRDQPIKSNN